MGEMTKSKRLRTPPKVMVRAMDVPAMYGVSEDYLRKHKLPRMEVSRRMVLYEKRVLDDHFARFRVGYEEAGL